MRRGVLLMMVVALTACGGRPEFDRRSPAASQAPSSCATGERPAAMPSPSCSLTPEEQWRRNQQANKAYRQRGPVQPGAEAAATPIAARLELVLKRVDDQDL